MAERTGLIASQILSRRVTRREAIATSVTLVSGLGLNALAARRVDAVRCLGGTIPEFPADGKTHTLVTTVGGKVLGEQVITNGRVEVRPLDPSATRQGAVLRYTVESNTTVPVDANGRRVPQGVPGIEREFSLKDEPHVKPVKLAGPCEADKHVKLSDMQAPLPQPPRPTDVPRPAAPSAEPTRGPVSPTATPIPTGENSPRGIHITGEWGLLGLLGLIGLAGLAGRHGHNNNHNHNPGEPRPIVAAPSAQRNDNDRHEHPHVHPQQGEGRNTGLPIYRTGPRNPNS